MAYLSSRAAAVWTPSFVLNKRLIETVVFAATTLIALALFNRLLARAFLYPDNLYIYAPCIGAFVCSCYLAGARYSEFSTLLSSALRASAAGLVAYLLLEWPDFTLANPDSAALAATYVNSVYWPALACALAGLVRPSFIVPAAIYIISTRHLVTGVSGLPMSTLDIRYMIDMALYLSIGAIGVTRFGPYIHESIASRQRQDEIVGAAFGLHLANYFWSGIAKIVIGPTAWYWIFENKTHNQIPHAIEAGILPLGHVPWLAELAYEALRFAVVPLNAIIVFVQVFAIFCILRINWLKVTSFLYDCLHLGIYVFGGLFFWPWIWNNLTIWWAARSNNREMSLNTKTACIVAILLGYPGLKLNEAAWLAWFDIADARQVYFVAVTNDGREIKVPSAYFLSHSYSVSHAYMGMHPLKTHYDHTMQASARTVERNEWSGTCPDPATLPQAEGENVERRLERQASLARFLRAHHEKMVDREAMFGLGSYYVHLHHHPSNPFLYPEFNQLRLSDVAGYKLVLESVCHRLENGEVAKFAWAKDAEYFDVR